MNLYVLSYNNYYNRIVKKENNYRGYAPFVIYGPVQGVYGFTPGDGVNTVQVLGSNVQMYNGEGDYLLAVNGSNEIDSRWFIIDTKRERNGQWTLTLHRDLVVDFYDQLLDSPMFIEKATLTSDNPLIFNSEQMTLNQIKTAYNRNNPELLIKDKTNCAWLVGYYARKNGESTTTITGTIPDPQINYNFRVADITQWEYYQYTEQEDLYFTGPSNDLVFSILTVDDQGYYYSGYDFWYQLTGSPFTCSRTLGSLSTDFTPTLKQPPKQLGEEGFFPNVISAETVLNQFRGKEIELETLALPVLNVNSRNQFNEVKSLNNQVVFDEATGIFYQITVEPVANLQKEETFIDSSGGPDANTLFGVLARGVAAAGITGTPNSKSFFIESTSIPRLKISKRAIAGGGYSYTIAEARVNLQDAPYDMFCIPFGEINIYDNGQLKCTTTKDTALATAYDIVSKTVGTNTKILYDLQLLPYCPVPNYFDSDGDVDVATLTSLNYSWVEKSEAEKINIIFHAQKSSHSDYIPLKNPIRIANSKMESMCDMYRLCSPNFNSAFEFNAAKNGGLNGFNIYYTYYPYNPYIQVSPDFNRLYGQNFNDSRGLICQGDFSLSIVTDAWAEYQLSNKNYLNSFNREIENMEIQHKAGRIQDIVGGITGAAAGVAGGALTGSSAMPGIGAAVGAAVGGVVSTVGGVADYAINEMLRNEALDYKRDMFGYQLGNIRALPQTISKVSAITVNNRIFPFMEYYTCTDTEKEALAKKIAWNGMSVGAIGTLNDYIDNNWSYTINGKTIKSNGYIKGQLIRLKGTDDDYHIVNSLAGELNKGVYTKWE